MSPPTAPPHFFHLNMDTSSLRSAGVRVLSLLNCPQRHQALLRVTTGADPTLAAEKDLRLGSLSLAMATGSAVSV